MDAPTPPSPGFGRLRQIFLAHFPGFGGFETGNANFHMHERGYKDELVARYHSDVQPLLGQAGEEGAAALHGAILALLTKPLPSSYVQNLVGWRTRGYLDKLDAPARVRFGTLAQDLLGGPGDVSTRLDRFYPGALALLRSAGAGGPAHVRSLATLLLMLQDPAQHIFVRIGTFNTAAQELLGGKLIGHGAMPTGEEYGKVLDLAGRVKGGLEGQGWPPRDMVDVQSFIWVAGGSYGGASEPDPSYPDDEDQQSEQPEAAMPPVNLILHGPPGTGKT